MNLELSDEEAKALADELDAIVRNDRYPLVAQHSTAEGDPRQAAKPVREPLPEPKGYVPPRAMATQRRRGGR
jgi:hypothetical protein